MAKPQVAPQGRLYDAFISYSHAADGEFAPALQRGLQQIGRSWRQRRSLEVFRDETGLAVNPDLWASILAALDSSQWFVLLASPRAAESRWVGQEIEHCVQTKGAERILIVLTSGTLDWDEAAGDFTAESDAAHPALRGLLPHKPGIVDMSWVGQSTQTNLATLTNDNEHFRADVATIAAIIKGETVESVVAQDVAERKRTRTVIRSAVAALAILGLTSLGAAGLAVTNQREAAAERDVAEQEATQAAAERDSAEEQARIAVGRELSARASALNLPPVQGSWTEEEGSSNDQDLVDDSRAALAIAAEGYTLAPDAQTTGTLLSVISGSALASGLVQAPEVLPAEVAPTSVAASSLSGRVVINSETDGRVIDLQAEEEWALTAPGVAITPDGNVAIDAAGRVMELTDEGEAQVINSLPAPGGQVSFSSDGSRAAYPQVGQRASLVVADLATGDLAVEPLEHGGADDDCRQCSINVALSPDGAQVVMYGSSPVELGDFTFLGGTTDLWTFSVDQQAMALTLQERLPLTEPELARFSDDGSQLWVRDGGQILRLDPATLEEAEPALPMARGGDLTFGSDTQALISANECEPAGLVSAPALAVVATLPGTVDYTEGGCIPTGEVLTWLAGEQWILTDAGVWPTGGDDLNALACAGLGGPLSAEEFSAVSGFDREPEACS